MAIAPLERRLDQASEALEIIDRSVEIADAQPPAPIPESPAPEQMEEPVLVAGPISGLRKILRKGKGPAQRVEPTMTPEAQAIAEQRDAVKAATDLGVADQAAATIAVKTEQAKRARPELTPEALAAKAKDVGDLRATTPPELEKPDLTRFNLTTMETPESVKTMVETLSRELNLKVDNITFDDVVKSANAAGMDQGFINRLTSGKLEVNPENTYRALNVMVASAAKLDGYMQKIATGAASADEQADAARWIHFHSVLQDSVAGYQTNVAQSLAVMRIPRTGQVNLQAINDSIGNQTDIVKFALAYIDAGTPEGKAAIIKTMAQGTPWEKAFTVYVNALLYGAGTMVKNAVSTALFTPYKMAERGLAAGIGAGRQLVGIGQADRYQFQEVPAMLGATGQAVVDGWHLMAHAFKKGYPDDWIDPDKIARSQQRMQIFKHGDPRFWQPQGSLVDAGIWGLNAAITLPGRTILSTDQFFKGLNYRYELVAEQTRAGLKAADEARLAGRSDAEIKQALDNAVDEVASRPPEHIQTEAVSSTFAQRVEGNLGAVIREMNPTDPARFALRTFLPFLNTPVNIVSAVVERTPLAFASSNVRAAIKMGGKEGDLALAKVGLASAGMYGMTHVASAGMITGSGPGDRAQREAMVRQGWQPYSIVIDRSGVDEDIKRRINDLPGSATYGSGDYEGKIFLSYQGLEPIGALMAIAADYVDYVKYEEDDSRVNAFVGGAAFGLANYIMEHPFLTGVGEVATLLGSGIPNSRAKVVEILNFLGEKSATVGLTIADPFIRPQRFVRQQTDPYVRDYQMNPNAPAGMKGLMDALNKWRASTPGLSDDLPPKLNIWGEPAEYEYVWSPLRMKEGKATDLDKALIAMNANVAMPARSVSMRDPVTGITADTKMDAAEYNEMLRIANQELRLQDLLTEVVDAIRIDSIKDEKDLIFYQNEVARVFEKVFGAARQKLAQDSEFSEAIQTRIADKAQRLKEFGRGVR